MAGEGQTRTSGLIDGAGPLVSVPTQQRRRASKPVRDFDKLRARLDQLVATFDLATISPDPLELPRRYSTRDDQEVAGLIAAAFAYGRASHIVSNIGGVLVAMGPSPAEYVRAVDADEARSRFKAFRHRFHKSEDLVGLLERISGVLRAHGSLGSLFRSVYREEEKDISGSLSRFVRKILESGPVTAGPALKRLEYLLSSPSDGSACKRMNLYLRWMVRRTSPDLGLWTFVEPSRLLIPVDTHVHRISTFLGLNHRKSADWQAARAITDQLSRFDPKDPVRYDFALCRLGILDLCSRKRRKEQCHVCLLRDVCRFPVA